MRTKSTMYKSKYDPYVQAAKPAYAFVLSSVQTHFLLGHYIVNSACVSFDSFVAYDRGIFSSPLNCLALFFGI